jgi:hypothetical protein
MIIGKFPLETTDRQVLEIPAPAQILSVVEQRGEIVLYAILNPDAPTVTKVIDIYGTGHQIPKERSTYMGEPQKTPGTFLGTVATIGGSLMWHVFDATDAE